MKKSVFLFTIALMAATLVSFIKHNELGLNSTIPMASERMKDVSGKFISLNEVKTKKGLLVIFSCNTCPYVKLSESRIKLLTDSCVNSGIGCIILNSNEAERAEDDSFVAMVNYAAKQNFSCYYAVDVNSKLADAFGATRTPQCFLFNAAGLIYKGAIDDYVKDATMAKAHYLNDAIDALLRNELPSVQETKSIGCTIKRSE
jgi:hypothetical protein